MARVLEQGLPAILRHRPGGPRQRFLMDVAARLDPVRGTTLAKYEHQFGTGGIAAAPGRLREIGEVDLSRLDVPLLGLVGESEDVELQRQAREVFGEVVQHHSMSRLVTFAPDSGADAHCQVNNLPLATAHVFDWLSSVGMSPLRTEMVRIGREH